MFHALVLYITQITYVILRSEYYIYKAKAKKHIQRDILQHSILAAKHKIQIGTVHLIKHQIKYLSSS